ncbi:MAG: prepilin-type N-terminal cleavage/methylation domain-containing protein [Verrucomicrobia bacterium]|nr:prepilin-type N-terminal cleavage/methylation domain-containing protein [Verrucomicrobiota bacterium]
MQVKVNQLAKGHIFRRFDGGKSFCVRSRRAAAGFTLAEVMIAAGLLAVMGLSLYITFNSGLGSVSQTREEERATQIMSQKLEAIRLLTWTELGMCPTSFKEFYNPQGIANNTAGTVYYGKLSTQGAATNVSSSATYYSSLHLVTVTLTWTNNFNGTAPIAHTRQMSTLSASTGLQQYIYGN